MDTEKINKKGTGGKKKELVFVLAVFLYLFLWAVITPFNSSPDEEMRYDVAEYIMENKSIPDGRDPAVRNELWGISYAFNPVTSQILGGIFGMAASLFTDDFFTIIMAMRMVNVIFGALTAWIVLKIGKKLFEKEAAVLFSVLVCFLPGAVFVFTYMNMDGIALFSTAWILYLWVRACESEWTLSLSVQLAAAMSVCVLSYYNAYGYLLCSAVLFAGMFMKCQKKQWDFSNMLKKGFLILGIVAVLTGWWFIRNAILYDGDILGMKTSGQYAQMYAIEELKPSNRQTPSSMGMTFSQMCFWIPGEWRYNWMGTVAASFIGTFGYLKIFMPAWWTKMYLLIFAAGLVMILWRWKEEFIFFRKYTRKKEKQQDKVVITRQIEKCKVWNTRKWMNACMLLAAVIPVVLLCYYAYEKDFQAQGRYIMPALIPIMYFVTRGWDLLLKQCIKTEKVRKIVYKVLSCLLVLSSVAVFIFVYAPNYIG